MKSSIQAIIFDLYGTLVQINERTLHKEVPRLLGVSVRRWMEAVRDDLMIASFPDRARFVRHICDSLAPGAGPEVEEKLMALVEREIASVEPVEGVSSVLPFLKRRGYALGLLSNLSSIHKEPVNRLGLGEYFTAMSFSCDEGMLKPDPRIYLDLCARLGAEPQSVLVVGDSWKNDVQAPKKLGMNALAVGAAASESSLPAITELGWILPTEGGELVSLLSGGEAIKLGQSTAVVRDLSPLPDREQGRYNLVASARAEIANHTVVAGESIEVFCKRYLFPEAAYVEECAHRVLAEAGLPSCDAVVTSDPEPCLVVSKAPGSKFTGPVDPPLAYELGRHSAAAYLFANADLRPRNAFVSYDGARPVITMVDLEHFFFNLALDSTGLENPFRPENFDRLSGADLSRRIRRRVLSARATRRAMRSFFELESLESELGRMFKQGWVDTFCQVKEDCERICRFLEQRVTTEPFLIIGTRSYRRAMAKIDVQDMRQRIEQDPEEIFPALAALKRSD